MQRPSPSSPASNAILAHLRATHGAGAWISLERFVEAALYTPEIGYYRQSRTRVGHAPGRDFYTAHSLGQVFRNLVVAAIDQLAPEARDAWTLVELGAEPDRHLFSESECPFPIHLPIGAGDPLEWDGPAVVFSNELFDAQPFRSFERKDGAWQERGIRLDPVAPQWETRPTADLPSDLPVDAPEGYQLDYPSGSRQLLERIVTKPWKGLFLAFDYGLPWETIATARPEGVARTYHQHQLGSDLLADPGERDITHHICWDHLEAILQAHGFGPPRLESQEAFFMRHATSAIARLIENRAGAFDADRQTLKTLLHPENMGTKFQVLHARRG